MEGTDTGAPTPTGLGESLDVSGDIRHENVVVEPQITGELGAELDDPRPRNALAIEKPRVEVHVETPSERLHGVHGRVRRR